MVSDPILFVRKPGAPVVAKDEKEILRQDGVVRVSDHVTEAVECLHCAGVRMNIGLVSVEEEIRQLLEKVPLNNPEKAAEIIKKLGLRAIFRRKIIVIL